MPERTRRAALAALGVSLSLGGCQVFRSDTREPRTLTPAAVPEVTAPDPPEDGSPARTVCPQVPPGADAYVCSPRASPTGSLRLHPTVRSYDSGTGGLPFTLVNGTESAFRTGRDWWVLGARDQDGWSVVARGERTDRMRIGPGGQFVWTLGGDGDDRDGTRLDVAFGGGPHALAVTGYLAPGDLTSVVAPFRVQPNIG
jgi:hypothetical protein